MKKTLTMILTAALIMGTVGSALALTGCGKGYSRRRDRNVSSREDRNGRSDRRGNDDDDDNDGNGIIVTDHIRQLQQREGPMLLIGERRRDPIDRMADEITGTDYIVYWDGTVVRRGLYSISDAIESETTISDEDYLALYSFADHAYLNDTYVNYHEDYLDGITFSFDYYPEEGEPAVTLYDGYCYDNDDLEDIVVIAQDIFDDYLPVYGPLGCDPA